MRKARAKHAMRYPEESEESELNFRRPRVQHLREAHVFTRVIVSIRDTRDGTSVNRRSIITRTRSSMPILLSLINDLTAGERPIVRRADSNRPVNDSFSARHFSLRDSSILVEYIVLKINEDLDSPLVM